MGYGHQTISGSLYSKGYRYPYGLISIPFYSHVLALKTDDTKDGFHSKRHIGKNTGKVSNTYVQVVPSGKHTQNYGKSPFSMGKSTISMAIFNSYVK